MENKWKSMSHDCVCVYVRVCEQEWDSTGKRNGDCEVTHSLVFSVSKSLDVKHLNV